MKPLTIHLIIQNNEDTISHCLDSISFLNADILIADIGCKDGTLEICKKHGAKIVKLSLNDDFSKIRNKMWDLSQSLWNFYIEPWETLLSGGEHLLKILSNNHGVFKVNILQGDLLTRQTRIWHKNYDKKFTNPVFETLTGESEYTSIFLAAGQNPNHMQSEIVQKWLEKNPMSNEPNYYLACLHLMNKNWDAFLNLAGLYLHREKSDPMTVYMSHYYSSMVYCYIKKDYEKSIKSLLPCLLKNPTMAEFWCLLGDSYYAIKDYERATCFYENALIMGSRRLKNDNWFMEISKYQSYPNKMIEACKKIKESSKNYKLQIQVSE